MPLGESVDYVLLKGDICVKYGDNIFDKNKHVSLRIDLLDTEQENPDYAILRTKSRPKDNFINNFDLEKDWAAQWTDYRKKETLFDIVFDNGSPELYKAYHECFRPS